MSHTVIAMVTEKFTVILYTVRSTNYSFNFNGTLQVLAGFGNWKETAGNTKPLKAIKSCMTHERRFFLPHFKNIKSFCRLGFGV